MSTLANKNKVAKGLRTGRPCPRGFRTGATVLSALVFAFSMVACVVGPKYARPPVETPPSFKEIATDNQGAPATWKTAEPKDAALRDKWWEVYGDPKLNELEEHLNASNQNIAAAAANFMAARTLVTQARSQYFPNVSANPSIVYSRPSAAQFAGLQSANSSGAGLSVKSFTNYSLPFDASS